MSGLDRFGQVAPALGADRAARIVTEAGYAVARCKPEVGAVDQTSALQDALDAAYPGQTIWLPKPESTYSRFIRVGDITIPSGVSVASLGSVLWMDGATVSFSGTLAQEYNSVIRDVWFKRAKFNIEDTIPISAIVFDHSFLDGTDLSNSGSIGGDCIFIGNRAYDVYLSNGTRVNNYTGWAVDICGNSDSINLNGAAHIGTGVHIGMDQSCKIFNCGAAGSGGGIRARGSSQDGMSIHVEALLDHLQHAIYVDNENAITGNSAAGGGVVVLADSLRVELCGKVGAGPETPVIYNRRGTVEIGSAWVNTSAISVGHKLFHNHKGQMHVRGGRVSAAHSNAYVIYSDGVTAGDSASFDGVITQGVFYNVRRPVISAERTDRELIAARMVIQGQGGGQIKVQLISADGGSLGIDLMDTTQSAAFGKAGAATVGTGPSEVIYSLGAGGGFLGLNPYKVIGKVFSAAVCRNTGGTAVLSDSRMANGGADAQLIFRNATTGAEYDLTTMTAGQEIEVTMLFMVVSP